MAPTTTRVVAGAPGRMRARMGEKKKDRDAKARRKRREAKPLPPSIAPTEDAPRIETKFGSFDIDDPILPEWVEREALSSDGYPYDKPIKDKHYEEELEQLQIELVKMQRHIGDAGLRMVLVFEGRDAAGKGGSIFALRQYLNPALGARRRPAEAERGRAWAVVFPALCRPFADQRRNGPLRPLLVQPRRRRAGHGLLHRRKSTSLSSRRPPISRGCWSIRASSC